MGGWARGRESRVRRSGLHRRDRSVRTSFFGIGKNLTILPAASNTSHKIYLNTSRPSSLARTNPAYSSSPPLHTHSTHASLRPTHPVPPALVT